MSKYYLVGIPNCGKSTLGRRTSDSMKMPFFDTDNMAEDQINNTEPAGLSYFDYVSRFHYEQQKAVARFSNMDPSAIVATGAEIALIPECVKHMRSTGFIIFIERDVEKALKKQKNKPDYGRLVLVDEDNGNVINMSEERVKVYAKELPQYRVVADFTLDNDGSEEEGTEKLVTLIRAISGKRVS